MIDPFADLPKNHFGALLVDPPWSFQTWSAKGRDRCPGYPQLSIAELARFRVGALAKSDAVLFLWATWPMIETALALISQWGFQYKTCAFCWTKPNIGLGYWTRAQTEPCLLATRGKPKRLHADVRQAIIAPRREHSRKPDIHGRIERLVAGPYLELFARQTRAGWTYWGNEVGKFDQAKADRAWSEMWAKPFHRPELLGDQR